MTTIPPSPPERVGEAPLDPLAARAWRLVIEGLLKLYRERDGVKEVTDERDR